MKPESEDLSQYKVKGVLTLLQLMGLLVVVGIVAEVIFRYL